VGAPLGAAWDGLAQPTTWNFLPLVWAAVLLLAAGLVMGRVRWWVFPAAFAAGLPCDTIAEHFGIWAGIMVVVMVAVVLATASRIQRSG